MGTLFFLFLFSIILSASFTGCGEKIPNIEIGSDRCDSCGMVISHVKYAGIYHSETEKRWKRFDDIGCMVMEAKKKKDVKDGTMYVFDYNTGERINARKAYYVVSADIWTPMNSGIVAFKDEGAAENFAAKYGVGVISFDELMRMKISMGAMEGGMGDMGRG